MMKFFIVFLAVWSLLTSHARAMLVGDSQTSGESYADIIFTLFSEHDVEITDIVHLCLTNKELHRNLNNDRFWQSIYACRFSTMQKNQKDLDYKENFKAYPPPIVVFSTGELKFSDISPKCLPNRCATGVDKIIYENVHFDRDSLLFSEFKEIWKSALDKNPSVFCTIFSVYQGEDALNSNVREVFDEAKTRDILIVLPAGNCAGAIPESRKLAIQ